MPAIASSVAAWQSVNVLSRRSPASRRARPAMTRRSMAVGVSRAARRSSISAKRSFGSQSDRGCRFAARIMTVTHTLRKQKRHVLSFLTRACQAAHTACWRAPTPPAQARPGNQAVGSLREGRYRRRPACSSYPLVTSRNLYDSHPAECGEMAKVTSSRTEVDLNRSSRTEVDLNRSSVDDSSALRFVRSEVGHEAHRNACFRSRWNRWVWLLGTEDLSLGSFLQPASWNDPEGHVQRHAVRV